MQSVKIDVFFSCSFRDEDKEVNDYFIGVCNALDLAPTNVDGGSSKIPPEEAKRQITEAQALIAVCTKRDEMKDGRYHMPQAVHDEISFAFGIGTPVLLFVEDGVVLEGFKQNFGTYSSFERAKILDPAVIEKTVRDIHRLKLDVLGPHQLGTNMGMSDAIAEFVYHSVELKSCGSDYIWEYSTAKKLVFQHESKRRFPFHIWTEAPTDLPDSAPPIEWTCHLKSSSNDIEIFDEVEEHSPRVIRGLLKLLPHPQKDDFIEYETHVASRYLNSVWKDEVNDGQVVHLDDGDYSCVDGLIFTHRTKRAVIEFRFDRKYRLKCENIRTFVASYTSGMDYEVPSEEERAKVTKEDFAGSACVRIEIESPLPGHFYGVAWEPLERPLNDPEKYPDKE